MRRLAITATLVIIPFSLIAASSMPSGDIAPTTDNTAAVDVKSNLAGSYLSGRFAGTEGDMRSASDYLTHALQQDPTNQALMSEAFKMYLTSGEVKKSVELARALMNDPDHDPAADYVTLVEEIHTGNFKEAQRIVAKLKNTPGLASLVFPLTQTWLDVAEGKVKKPVRVEQADPAAQNFLPFMHYHLALMNDEAGFDDVAQEYYLHALNDVDRMPLRVVEALANFYARRGQQDKVASLFEEYRAQNPEGMLDGEDLLPEWMESEAADKSRTPRALIGTPQEGVAEIFYSLASILYSEGIAAESLSYLRLALYLRPDFPPAQLLLGNLLERVEDYAAAQKVFESVSPGTPYYFRAQLRHAMLFAEMGDPQKTLKMLDDLAARYPKDYSTLVAKGDQLRNAQRFDEAAAAYSAAIARIADLKAQHWPLFYVRGICYERAGQWEKAEQDLNQALKLEPGQPDVLNYLGYSWLVMGKNKEAAKGMIERALAARPNEAHIIDSMGWAMFITGDYASALKYMERAVDINPSDPTINDHLGDVYWRVGRQSEARFQWERALIYKPDEKMESDIRRKLEVGLPASQNGASLQSAKDEMPLAATP